jgi:alpha-tubulin suppressor-like RCC1 family protein
MTPETRFLALPLVATLLLTACQDPTHPSSSLTEVGQPVFDHVMVRPDTPQEEVEELIELVEELRRRGVLTDEQADGLRTQLEEILAKIDAGNLHAAEKQLQAFINHVRGFIRAGVLGADDGDDLITGAEATADRVSGAVVVVHGLVASRLHACFLNDRGAAFCWGNNAVGQLGTGSSTGPESCGASTETFVALTAGFSHTCGLTAGAAAFCWGNNAVGQLGTGSSTGPESCGASASPCSTTPVAVTQTFVGLTAAVGGHTCGLTASGAALCWGSNDFGELGNGSSTGPESCGALASPCSTTPVAVMSGAVPSGEAFVALAAGRGHTCGLVGSGAAFCWGSNGLGELGNGSSTGPESCGASASPCSTTPVAVMSGAVPSGEAFMALAAGRGHMCGLIGGGAAFCWGGNFRGQLGQGGTTGPESCGASATPCSTTPVAVMSGAVPSGETFVALTAGENYTCGSTTGGSAFCWGRGTDGQLGDGTFMDRHTPVAVLPGAIPPGETFVALTAGEDHTCGRTAGGAAFCWGLNDFGKLGNGTTTDSPTAVAVDLSGVL